MAIYGRNIDLYRDYLMINEAYIGKTPTLEKIEEKIGEARKKIKFYGANNTLKEILEVNRLFEKQFGMDVYGLQIYPSKTLNAYSMVLATNFDIAENVNLRNMITGNITDGYKFVNGNNFCILVNIASSIMMEETFTDAEIVAILLHELGHNFADCIYDDIDIYNKELMVAYKRFLIAHCIMAALLAIPTFGLSIPAFLSDLNSLAGSKFSNKKKNVAQKNTQKEGKGKIGAFIGGLKGKCDDVSQFISGVISRLGGGGSARATMRYYDAMGVPAQMRKSIGRQNEVIADKFAGIYGYGPALTSALLKLDSYQTDSSKFVDKIAPGRNSKYEEVLLRINDYDVHPHSIQRANEDLKLLRNELKKEDLDPKVRKVIEGQIAEIEDIINKYIKTSEEFSKNENARKLYAAYVKDECPDAVDQEIEDKIEQALDDALNNKKGANKK